MPGKCRWHRAERAVVSEQAQALALLSRNIFRRQDRLGEIRLRNLQISNLRRHHSAVQGLVSEWALAAGRAEEPVSRSRNTFRRQDR